MMTSTIEASKPIQCNGCPFLSRRQVPPRGAQPAPIMLLGDNPALRSPVGGSPFSDRNGAVIGMALRHLQQMYRNAKDGMRRWGALQQFKSYTVQCCSDDKPNKEVSTKCRHFLEQSLQATLPRVIVVFGATALHNLMQRQLRFDDVRGSFLDFQIDQGDAPSHKCKVFVTFSPKAVMAQPGLYDDLVRDLRRAFLYAEGRGGFEEVSEEELAKDYLFPHTIEEVRRVCQDIINYHLPGDPPEKHIIAVDTETTTLEMHDPNAKIIMISFAWDVGKATSIVLDHPAGWWTPDELEEVKYHVRRVLACPKPKVYHNEKFDRQAIVHRYGWAVENIAWDTLGGEHLNEEDKKGQYGLKVLTRTRLPKYAGYEDKVDEIRREHGGRTRAQEAKRFRKAEAKYEDALKDFTIKMDEYDRAYGVYQRKLEAWQTRRAQEKEEARVEKRRMNKEAYGKKPPKPRKPRPPKEPQQQEPFDFTLIPLPKLEFYAAVDADVTRQHLLHQNLRLNDEYRRDVAMRQRTNEQTGSTWPIPLSVKRLMRGHVIPTSRTLADMEFTGFPVDLDYVEELDEKLRGVVEETEKKLYDLAGGPFVISSPKEIVDILFNRGFYDEKTGNKVTAPIDGNTRKTAKGQIKADEKALLYVANTFGYEFPKVVLQYRKAQKARSPFLINVREHAVFDGRMHPQFHLSGTATGRLSSSDENMQNIPKKLAGYNIKKIFVPPEGHTLINTDAKGAEVRIFAAYSGDERLIQAILDGLDAHSFFTSRVFGVEYDAVEKARDLVDEYYADKSKFEALLEAVKAAEALVRKRTNCKRVVFGTLYGALAPKIAETAGISLEEAQEVIDLMFRMFPSIPAYIDSTQKEVMLFKGVYTYTGRKRRFPIVDLRSFRNRCFRQAVNFKIQSTSSDIVLWVLNQIFPVVKHDLRGQFHATVHDSIVFSVPHAYVGQVRDLMTDYGTDRVQKEFPWLPVPFLWDVEAGPSYGEVSDIRKYMKGQEHDRTPEEIEELITDEELVQELNAAADSAY